MIPTRYRLPWLLLGFTPWYAKHLVVAPYRDAYAGLAARHRTALYDGVLNLMLNGYSALSGRKLPHEAGRMAVLFTRIAFAFDDEYERRRASGEGVGFEEVFGAPAVQERVETWRCYMTARAAYPSIKGFLETFVRKVYSEYAAARPRDFPGLLKAAELDSGGMLVAVATIVTLAQERTLPDGAAAAFAALGVLGKLIDDVIDLRMDRRKGEANLLEALATLEPGELETMERAVCRDVRMDISWWRRECPNTFSRYRDACDAQYARLRSGWLKYAANLLWVPALLGRSTVTDRRGRM